MHKKDDKWVYDVYYTSRYILRMCIHVIRVVYFIQLSPADMSCYIVPLWAHSAHLVRV